MDVLKQMAVRQGVKGGEKSVITMHKAFLSGVNKRGRMHELSLIREIRLKSGGLFNDLRLGLDMFRKGKLSLLPKKIKNMREVKALFSKARRST
jgi:hypothetical protein